MTLTLHSQRKSSPFCQQDYAPIALPSGSSPGQGAPSRLWIREFESSCPSHPVSSLCRTSVRQKCLRYFRRLAPENRSLSCGICSNSTFIRDFLHTVSNRQFSISEIRSRRLGSHLAETGSMSAIRRRADIWPDAGWAFSGGSLLYFGYRS